MEAIRLVGEGGLDRDEEAALAARDDLAAFAPLYERHRDAVYRYLRARCRTEDDAVELTAVTFERALGAAGVRVGDPTALSADVAMNCSGMASFVAP